MTRFLPILALTAAIGSLFYSSPAGAQPSPTTKKTAHVQITRGPEIERAEPDLAIVRWETTNPGGSPLHFGIVRYGTDPKKLSQTASSPIRLNPDHSHTSFRVRVDGLEPRTTYYYMVESMEANGKANGAKCTIKHFTTSQARP
jgi:phosphodiesterase/alkaline phosphatase D-like protein